MPGSVSDSYDPEFGTSTNASIVYEGVKNVRDRISHFIGDPELKNIVEVCQGPMGLCKGQILSERSLRIIRFCMNRALESL